MNVLISVDDMTADQLRELIERCERRKNDTPADTHGWSRARLIAHIEFMQPAPRGPYKKKKKKKAVRRRKKKRMPHNLGVGRHCLELLQRVIGHDREGHPLGLSYMEMMKMAQEKFPDSAVDERHLRWYAAKARRDDVEIPVYRKRSRWI